MSQFIVPYSASNGVDVSHVGFIFYNVLARPCGMLVFYSRNRFGHVKGNIILVLMLSNIVNGHKMLCDAHTVFE